MQFIPFYLEMILIKLQFLININSISIISWVLLSISITISITKTGPYQYQYIINFSNFSLSISIPISISQFFPINISLSMHCATLFYSSGLSIFDCFALPGSRSVVTSVVRDCSQDSLHTHHGVLFIRSQADMYKANYKSSCSLLNLLKVATGY